LQADWKITEEFSIMTRAAVDTYNELQEERKAIGSVAGEMGVDSVRMKLQVIQGLTELSMKEILILWQGTTPI
jgi:hypothetical protein